MGAAKDGEQPGPSGRRIPKPAVAVERPQGRLLEQVLGVGFVSTAEPERGAVEGVEVLGEDLLERPGRRTCDVSSQRATSGVPEQGGRRTWLLQLQTPEAKGSIPLGELRHAAAAWRATRPHATLPPATTLP